MEDLFGGLPVWGLFALAVIYVVVKLVFEFVDRHNKRQEENVRKGKSDPPKNPQGSKSFTALKAMADQTGRLAVRQEFDEREERARSQEMHQLLRSQEQLIKQLAESDKKQSALLEQLANGQNQTDLLIARMVTAFEQQGDTLAKIQRDRLDEVTSWDTLRMSIDKLSRVVGSDTLRPSAPGATPRRR